MEIRVISLVIPLVMFAAWLYHLAKVWHWDIAAWWHDSDDDY